ncbi:MAG: DNA polymerase IV, partial [Chitinophagaceae bacterium]
KSVGAEDTFSEDLTELDRMKKELEKITATVETRLKKHGLKGRTVTLKIKYSDFKKITRSQSLSEPLDDFDGILEVIFNLLIATGPEDKKIRLMGVTLSNFA